MPVKFVKLLAGNALVFENPAHDFPQKISYTQVNPDSPVAEISGISKGKPRLQQFKMGRIKP